MVFDGEAAIEKGVATPTGPTPAPTHITYNGNAQVVRMKWKQSLYRTGEDRYVIASPGYDQDDDQEELPPGWTLLAGLITDLWAYALADYEHWRSRGGDPDSLDWGDTVTDVTPGSYQVTSHGGERGFDTHATGTVIFAHIGQISTETEKQ